MAWRHCNKLLPEAARAFLRHAYNCFYHDFANVDLKDLKFIWQITFAHATRSFQDAVLRYGMRLRILFNTRMCSTLQGVAPPEARKRYPKLIDIGPEGDFSLTNTFRQAVELAQQNADAEMQQRRQLAHNNQRR